MKTQTIIFSTFALLTFNSFATEDAHQKTAFDIMLDRIIADAKYDIDNKEARQQAERESRTSLMIAVERNQPEIVRTLIEAGAEYDIDNKEARQQAERESRTSLMRKSACKKIFDFNTRLK